MRRCKPFPRAISLRRLRRPHREPPSLHVGDRIRQVGGDSNTGLRVSSGRRVFGREEVAHEFPYAPARAELDVDPRQGSERQSSVAESRL